MVQFYRELTIHGVIQSCLDRYIYVQGVFSTGTPLKSSKYKKFNLGWLGVSRPIYVNVDTPNLGFPFFNFLGDTS